MKKLLAPAAWVSLWLAGPLVFLLAEYGRRLSGFPLDDAWIHQTYARSLSEGLGWTYAGSLPSAGSTSPLWTILQVPSFWLRLSPVLWTSAIGILLLLADAALIMLWIRKIHKPAAPFAMLFCLGEWHLIWAALSGMETILYCTWVALVFFLFFPLEPHWAEKEHSPLRFFLLGTIAGVGIWIRPEAVLLSGLSLLAVLIQWRPQPGGKAMAFLFGGMVPLLSFFLFTYRLNGHILPNTFFVKTTEYASLTDASLWLRMLQPWLPLFAGPLVILILFLPAALVSAIRNRKWVWCLPLIWALSHLALYAVRLPATYQHGRYFLPILPVLLAYGVLGYLFIKQRAEAALISRVVSRALWASALLLTAVFIWIGAEQFAQDVDIIDTEMVAVAVWIRDNTPPDTVVAAHDIGALGFFGQRRIIDLGGVTDLGALDLLSGSMTLKDYLRRKDADLLMTMPDFFPEDVAGCRPLPGFCAALPAGGSGRRTLVYAWRNGCAE